MFCSGLTRQNVSYLYHIPKVMRGYANPTTSFESHPIDLRVQYSMSNHCDNGEERSVFAAALISSIKRSGRPVVAVQLVVNTSLILRE